MRVEGIKMARIPGLMTCLAVACLTSLTVSFGAPNTFAVNLGGMATENSKTAESADASDTVKVAARGVGTDKVSALKDAFRDAIERAVGLYVDAETLVRNDEVVTDEILTHSNAYILKYDEGETTKTPDGLVKVRLVAVVKKRPLSSELKRVLPDAEVRFVGDLKDVHATIVSTDKRNADGATLMRKALSGVDPCTMLSVPSIDVEHNQVIREGKIDRKKSIPDDSVVLRCLLKLKFDEQKYFKSFVPPLKDVLEQVSLSAKDITLSVCENSEYIPTDKLPLYLKIGPDKSNNASVRHCIDSERKLFSQNPCMSTWRVLYGGGLMLGEEGFSWNLVSNLARGTGCVPVELNSAGYSSATGWDRRGENRRWWRMTDIGDDDVSWKTKQPFSEVRDCSVVLVTGVNKQHTVWTARLYAVDKTVAWEFYRWLWRYGSGSSTRHDGRFTDEESNHFLQYDVRLCDDDDETIKASTWQVPRVCVMNVDFGNPRRDNMTKRGEMIWYISPFLGCYSEEYFQWHDILLKKDMLPQIKSMNIELSN